MFAGKAVRVFLKGDAKVSYLKLKKQTDKESKAILDSFVKIKEILKGNPQFGDPLKKQLIPKKFKKIGIQNLYRVELSNYWRALYTVEGNQVEILVFVLTISDHKEYDKLLGYKKK